MADAGEEFLGVLDLEQWAFILNRFSEVLGIDIYTVDRHGKLITRPQHSPKILELIVSAKDPSWSKFQAPSDILRRLIRKSEQMRSSVEETGILGLTHALIPISGAASGPVAYVLVGPLLLGSRRPTSDLEKVALEQGWNAFSLESAYQELKLFSFVGMKAMLDLLSGVCNSFVQPTSSKKGREAAASPERLDNFFTTLLHLALLTTKADSGSVMVIDPGSRTLRIRAASGLKEEVVKQTEVKMGEGIAGWVAEHNQSLLIGPEKEIDAPLQNRLKRNEIDSSIVMPLSRQDQVLGVLSINSHSKENRLKAQSLDLVTQLAKLTMVVS